MSVQTTPKYKRVLLKLSGEALAGEKGILNHAFLGEVASVIKKCHTSGVEVAVLVGAGNIWRGRQGTNMDRVRADKMGMLATTINCMAIQDAVEQTGLDCRVMTAIDFASFTEHYDKSVAVRHLKDGRVVVFGCGIGIPFLSTDTAAAIRAAEIDADVILMAKNIDGIYSADPKLDPTATKYSDITYKEMLDKGLKATDITATSFCMENNIPLLVFGLDNPENIYRVIMGEKIGTTVTC